MRSRKRLPSNEAELDITSFMNLMIILVPVLLMTMVFSHVTALSLKLPDLNAEGGTNELCLPGCAEILHEIKQLFDTVVCASGTGGTLAGLLTSTGPCA